MVPEDTGNQPSDEASLPFDLIVLLRGLRRRWLILLAVVVVSGILGAVAGIFGAQTWEADTMLLYRQTTPSSESTLAAPPSLTSQMDMIKTRANIGETRRRLKIPATLETIGTACDVQFRRNTSVVTMVVTWGTAQGAADIANTLRDVFLEDQRRSRMERLERRILDLTGRLRLVKGAQSEAESALLKFRTTRKIVDIDQEADRCIEEMTSADLSLQKAQVDKKTIENQLSTLEKVIADLKKRVAEEATASASIESLKDTELHIKKLRERIRDDKTRKKQQADLVVLGEKKKAAERLLAKGVISKAEFERIRNAYENHKALMVDSDEVKAMKAEIEKLEKAVASPSSEVTLSGLTLQAMMQRSFTLQLDQIAAEENVGHLKLVRDRLEDQLNGLPEIHREYVSLSREVESREAERADLEEMLASTLQAQSSGESDFVIVTEAEVATRPAKSHRRILAIAVTALLSLIGLGAIFLWEIVPSTTRSAVLLARKLALPVLQTLPSVPPAKPLLPEAGEFALIDSFRILARKLRTAAPHPGARILIASAEHGEGRSMTAINLATLFGRMEERVLLVLGSVRSEANHVDPRDLISHEGGPVTGLGEYLAFETDHIKQIIWPTVLPGVECIPYIGEAVNSDLLATHRMVELMDEVSKQFTVVLVDGPAVLPGADAEPLANVCSSILFVVRSGACSPSRLKGAVERLRATGVPMLGTVLNDVNPAYLDRRNP